MNIEPLDGDRGKRMEIDGYVYVAVIIPGGYISINRLKGKSMKEVFVLPLKTEWQHIFNTTEIYHIGFTNGLEAGELKVTSEFCKLLRLPGP